MIYFNDIAKLVKRCFELRNVTSSRRLHFPTRKRVNAVFENIHFGERFWKYPFRVTVFTVYVWRDRRPKRIKTVNVYTCGRDLSSHRNCVIWLGDWQRNYEVCNVVSNRWFSRRPCWWLVLTSQHGRRAGKPPIEFPNKRGNTCVKRYVNPTVKQGRKVRYYERTSELFCFVQEVFIKK